MKRLLFRTALFSFWLLGCQPNSLSTLQEADPKELQGEIPLLGRSLFDQVTMVQDGEAIAQSIPYPFEALRSQLESKLEAPLTITLIPKGRSLQRRATPEPFRYPRMVMAALADGKHAGDDLGFMLRDRLYIGYVEPTNQLEVISYNPDMGRFEFQIVDNYTAGQKAQVRYANRDFCTACHQNEAPIFSNPGWDETAANVKIQDQLFKALGSERYLGVPIRQLTVVPNSIDDATDRANLLVPYQKLWSIGCDGDHCRRLSMEMALRYRMFGSFDEGLYATVKPSYELAWSKAFPQGLAIPQNNIPNFNPLQKFSLTKDSTIANRLSGDIKDRLERLAQDSDIPVEVEPLSERKAPLETWTIAAEDPARLIFAIAAAFQESDVEWLRQKVGSSSELSAALDRVEASRDSIFKSPNFVRCRSLAAIATSLESVLPACEFRAFTAMPPAQSTGKNGSVTPPNSKLKVFQQYCGSCHASGPLNFLEGDEATVLGKLQADALEHLARLNWESQRGGTMPPVLSERRKALAAKPEDRAEMMAILRELIGP